MQVHDIECRLLQVPFGDGIEELLKERSER